MILQVWHYWWWSHHHQAVCPLVSPANWSGSNWPFLPLHWIQELSHSLFCYGQQIRTPQRELPLWAPQCGLDRVDCTEPLRTIVVLCLSPWWIWPSSLGTFNAAAKVLESRFLPLSPIHRNQSIKHLTAKSEIPPTPGNWEHQQRNHHHQQSFFVQNLPKHVSHDLLVFYIISFIMHNNGLSSPSNLN